MKISDFTNIISEIPCDSQSFNIKKKCWKNLNQGALIDRIFDGNEVINVSRFDLFQSAWNLEEFVLKVLMWSYPSKECTSKIRNLLSPKNFNQLINHLILVDVKGSLEGEDLEEMLKIKGVEISNLSNILYFKELKFESYPCLIFNKKVYDALKSERFEDDKIVEFRNINFNNTYLNYLNYLKFIYSISTDLNISPDKLELFLESRC